MTLRRDFDRKASDTERWVAHRLASCDALARRCDEARSGASREGGAPARGEELLQQALLSEVGRLSLGLGDEQWACIRDAVTARARHALGVDVPEQLLCRDWRAAPAAVDAIAREARALGATQRLADQLVERYGVGCALAGLEVLWGEHGQAAARACLQDLGVSAWDEALNRACDAARLLRDDVIDAVDPVPVRESPWLGAALAFFCDERAPAARRGRQRVLRLLTEDRLRADFGSQEAYGWKVSAVDGCPDFVELVNGHAQFIGLWFRPVGGGDTLTLAVRASAAGLHVVSGHRVSRAPVPAAVAQRWSACVITTVTTFESYADSAESAPGESAEQAGTLVASATFVEFAQWVPAAALRRAVRGAELDMAHALLAGDVDGAEGRVEAFVLAGASAAPWREAQEPGRLAAAADPGGEDEFTDGPFRVSWSRWPSGEICVELLRDDMPAAAFDVEISSDTAGEQHLVGTDGVALLPRQLVQSLAGSTVLVRVHAPEAAGAPD